MTLHFLTHRTANTPVSLLGNYGTSSATLYNPASCTMDTRLFLRDVVAAALD